MPSLENPIYRFAEFELEPAERRLSMAGRSIALTPKVFDTLVLLVEQAGHAVSKDELMRVLWPRGYVDESNLTKHIWLIRRALGDAEQGTRYIETVPKLGYRFVTPVTVVRNPTGANAATPGGAAEKGEAAVETAVAAMPATTEPRRTPFVRAWQLGVVGIALLALPFAAWLWRSQPSVVAAQDATSRAVAITGFGNLSQNPKDAWLGPALVAMVGTELGVSPGLRIIPDELVRDARGAIAVPGTGGFSPDARERLRARLGADYVITGTYLVGTGTDDAPLRVDMTVQDARTGAIVAVITRQEHASALLAVVGQAGVTLREKLGVAVAGSDTAALVASAQPPSPEVARRLGFALDALQHYDAARARDELLDVVSQAPGFAPAYLELARAWSLLGYRDKALAAAEQASLHAGGLPPDQTLRIAAVVHRLKYDWAAAADNWRALVQLRPRVPEYRIELIDGLLAAGAVDAAEDALIELRRLPAIGDDPRVDLAAARVASARANGNEDALQAAQALRKAQRREFPGLVADARLELATAQWHLGRSEEAKVETEAAIEGYRAIANPRGEAAARVLEGSILYELHRVQEAREAYQRAMTVDQSIGDRAGVGAVYREMCQLLWLSGDRDGAQSAARQGQTISREIGDVSLEAWTTRALATVAADEAASDEVIAEYRSVVALEERSANRGGHMWSLVTLADNERLRGQLDQAKKDCDEAEREAVRLPDPQLRTYSGFTCALVAMDRGDTAAAASSLKKVAQQGVAAGNIVYVPNAQVTLAQLEMDGNHHAAARALLERARSTFATNEIRTGEANTEALLALCAQELGMREERDRSAARARELRRSITSRQEVYVVEIALAQLGEAPRGHGAAIRTLDELAADAERRHWLAWALEARLAAWKLATADRDTDASARLRQLETAAREHGFGRITNLIKGATVRAAA